MLSKDRFGMMEVNIHILNCYVIVTKMLDQVQMLVVKAMKGIGHSPRSFLWQICNVPSLHSGKF